MLTPEPPGVTILGGLAIHGKSRQVPKGDRFAADDATLGVETEICESSEPVAGPDERHYLLCRQTTLRKIPCQATRSARTVVPDAELSPSEHLRADFVVAAKPRCPKLA